MGSNAAGSARLLALLALAIAATLALSAPAANAAYTQVGQIGGTGPDGENGSGSEDGQFSNPNQADVNDATGTLYVADTGNDRVQAFTPSETGGSFSDKAAITAPTGLAVDQSDGSVYVANATGISKFDAGLNPVIVGWSDPGVTGTLAVDPTTGDLLVADQGANLVRRFESDGTAAGTFAAERPLDLAVDASGDLLVITSTGDLIGCAGTSALIRFDSTGTEEGLVGSLTAPGQVDVDPDTDEVLVAAPVNSYNCGGYPAIVSFDSSGSETGSLDLPDAGSAYVPGLAAQGNGSLRTYAVLRSPMNDFFVRTRVSALSQIYPPQATLDPVTTFTGTEAELDGTVDPNGLATEYRFELSKDGGNTWDSLGTESAGEGDDPVAVADTAENLDPNTAYQARLVATNQDGEATAGPESFQTPILPPTIVKQSASTTVNEASMAATIETGNAATKYRFEYGPTSAYGKSTLEKTLDGSTEPVTLSATVGGLTPGATYHYRVVVENSEGADEGDDQTFTLETPPPADACPNAAIRAEQGTSHLPHCRAYEMVSPVDKNGYSVFFNFGSSFGPTALSDDGSRAAFVSPAPFAGAKSGLVNGYLSERSEHGWTTRGISPAVVDAHPAIFKGAELRWQAMTPDLSTGVGYTPDSLSEADTDSDFGFNRDVYRLDADGTVELVSRGNGGVETTSDGGEAVQNGDSTMSRDGSTIAFITDSHLIPEDAERVDGVNDVYIRSGGATELVNQDDEGSLLSPCGSALGSYREDIMENSRNAISDDGSQVAFTVPQTRVLAGGSCGQQRVFVRLLGEGRTLEASASQRDPADPAGAQPATYVGAAADGSKVFFESNEMLTDDAPQGGGVYEFHPGDESLHFVAGTNGAPESGQSSGKTIRVSDDGSHVFFRKTVDEVGSIFVSAEGDVQQIATSTAGQNLWRLSAGGEHSRAGRPAYATPDGSALVFKSSEPVTDFDANGATQVYLWREGVDGVVCVSCDPAGQRPAGSTVREARMSEEESTTRVTDDGARSVFFTTEDRMVAADVNGARDVYEFTGGRLHLVSSGKGRFASRLVSTSKDGRSVMFATSDSLLDSDIGEGDIDLYVARSGGGFPEAPATQPPPCQGDSCQPPAAAPPTPPVASELAGGRAKAKPRKPQRCAKAKARGTKAKAKPCKQQRKKQAQKRKGNR